MKKTTTSNGPAAAPAREFVDLADLLEQLAAECASNSLKDCPAEGGILDRDAMARLIKSSFMAGVDVALETMHKVSPFAGILQDAKEGRLIRN